MMHLFEDPTFWVAAAFVLCVVLFLKPLARMIAKALDGHAANVQAALLEAEKLRAEAMAMRDSYEEKKRAVLQEAQHILKQAHEEADKIRVDARREVEAQIAKRTEVAMEKISRAEAGLLHEVRNNAIDLAIGAARTILKDQSAKNQSDEALLATLADIERKIH